MSNNLPKRSWSGHYTIEENIAYSNACAVLFSGMHYLGPLGDPFQMKSFVARMVLGLALTLVYAMRGFAAAVWTHALYDVWVLVL